VWSLSSAKPGFGVDQLRDGNLETYWQSDGPQPHTISIQWVRRMTIEQVSLYVDYSLDESYTPCHISIRAGTTFHDLKEIMTAELDEPGGWVHLPLVAKGKKAKRCHLLQVAILTNHQNGRDSHLRQVKVYGPSWKTTEMQTFSTVEYNMFSVIR